MKNEVLHIVKEERNILHTIGRSKDNCIDHIWRRNCLLKHVSEGNIDGRMEVTGKRGRKHKQLQDGLKEKIGYWKEEAPGHTLWRTRFGRHYGPVASVDTMGMSQDRSVRMYNLPIQPKATAHDLVGRGLDTPGIEST